MLTTEQKSTLSELFEEAITEIRTRHIAAGQKASGKTAASLAYEVTDSGGKITGRGYFATLETGRKPGATPKGFREIIKKWAVDKGIQVEPYEYKSDRPHKYTAQEAGLNRFAGAVANKIRKQGTVLFREGGRKDIYTPALDALTEKITLSLLEGFNKLVIGDIKRL